MKTRQCSLAVLALLLAGVTLAAGAEMCGLRPPADKEAVHPADLNADGEVTTEEFQEYAEAEAAGGEGAGEGDMDADGDGAVSTEEFVAFAGGMDAGPVDLTGDNFDEQTKGTHAAFVKFSAPWCNAVGGQGVRVGTVNCDQHREFCEMFQVQGFPTLLLMKDPESFEDATPVIFEKARNYDTLLAFLEEEGVLLPRDE
ncbi:hypothetical protein T484DRAFT_1888824 [Baffinella frigidus]|nr:hypothetical protein T484DRAFT_1888824 [Cryptophyta sp. CCMP2293]